MSCSHKQGPSGGTAQEVVGLGGPHHLLLVASSRLLLLRWTQIAFGLFQTALDCLQAQKSFRHLA